MLNILKQAIANNQQALSEYDSKSLIKDAGIEITDEMLATTEDEAIKFANDIGYPVVLKGCAHTLTHKTELDMVKLNLKNDAEVAMAYKEIASKGEQLDGTIVQEMIKGNREFVLGLSRDPQFGPCVMFGLGGIFTEVLKDVTFRVAPITEYDAEEMIDEIKTKELLDEFRGSPAVDKKYLIDALMGISNLAMENDEIAEIDINPVIISGNRPVAVDALVILKQ